MNGADRVAFLRDELGGEPGALEQLVLLCREVAEQESIHAEHAGDVPMGTAEIQGLARQSERLAGLVIARHEAGRLGTQAGMKVDGKQMETPMSRAMLRTIGRRTYGGRAT